MKKFTAKDFIAYNNPCFSCGERISFRLGIEGPVSTQLRPTVKPEYTVVDLKVTYTITLQLWIFHKSNKIITSDTRGFADFLFDNKLYLHSRCDKCMTTIQSQFLEFNIDKGYAKPTGISREVLIVQDNMNLYNLQSSFIEEKSVLTVDRIDKTTPISPILLELPLLPMYKFKDKEQFLNKIKTYLTFS